MSRKDVSLHSTFQIHAAEKAPAEEDFCGLWSSRGSLPTGADTGVKAGSELTDVRSVLRSSDVQEESDETEELLSTHSSCKPCLRSMAMVWKREEWNGNGKRKETNGDSGLKKKKEMRSGERCVQQHL